MKQPTNSLQNTTSVPLKRAVIYARVSTQEQTKGQYPSCESQIEELQGFCAAQGWQVVDSIKDAGHRAGTLKRPGLTHLRWLVQTGQVDVVACTWYNRLSGSRDFYILDKEFKAHGVTFTTIHDPADRNTAAGRLLESMLVTIKTFENEQVAEKVRIKLRMRAEKGLWNGGNVPFGFLKDEKTSTILPDPEKAAVVRQIFEVYVKTSSDFAVRDWLKARQIESPLGRPEWVPGAIRKLLSNRRYIAEIEINRERKGIGGLPETEAYRIVPTPHEPLVPRDLFELAQAIRAQGGRDHPNRGGKGKRRSYSNNQCQRVYTLQGLLVCGKCGHAMSPHCVHHKPTPNNKRTRECFIYHYCCAQKMKYRKACDHSNRVQAKVPEQWIVEQIREFVDFRGTVEKAMQVAYNRQF